MRERYVNQNWIVVNIANKSQVFGDDFVEHFGGTRRHEIRLWDEAVTDWEMKRYIETV